MRWNEQQAQPEKKKKEEKTEIPVKAGTKDFDYYDLSKSKKILTGRGEV